MMIFSEEVLSFLFKLKLPFKLSNAVGILDVHNDENAKKACIRFYNKFYSDNNERYLLLGINPGRFGGGVTGIPFTDPIRLYNECGIENDFIKKQELSSVFMYNMMNTFGGPKAFYQQFYISSISPIGFVKNGKNLNYYDDKLLMKSIEPFVIDCMEKQLLFGIKRDVCFCIGEGENFKYLNKLNDKHKWFYKVKALPHPRFVMQYRLKRKEEYIQQYLEVLKQSTF